MSVAGFEMVDVQFELQGSTLPDDYPDALLAAIDAALPWFREEPVAGIHPVSSLSPAGSSWYLSRRSRLTLRVPRPRAEAARGLVGASLKVGHDDIKVGAASLRELAATPVLYCKFVAFSPASGSDEIISETDFMSHCRQAFDALAIRPEMICGKARRARTSTGLLSGFSLLLTGIDPEANLRLQHLGLGLERKRGCGIFIPHKTFAAMGTLE